MNDSDSKGLDPLFFTRRPWFETFLLVQAAHGDRSFPLDMLRYASCLPATEVDSAVIARSLDAGFSPDRVILRRFSRETPPDLDLVRAGVRRWNAFGWEIVCLVSSLEEAEALRVKTGGGS